MQNDPNSLPPGRQRPNRTRLVGMSNGQYYKQENVNANDASINDIAMQPTVTMKSVPTTDRPSFQGTQPWNGSGNGNGNGMPGPWRGATPPQTPMPNERAQFRPSYPISNHLDPDNADIS